MHRRGVYGFGCFMDCSGCKMTIDEKIKQLVEEHIRKATDNRCSPKSSKYQEHKDFVCQCELADWLVKSANFVKSEMLADMQKLAEIAKEAISRIDCITTCRSNSDSWLVKCSCGAEKKSKELRQALAEFNAKYKEQK